MLAGALRSTTLPALLGTGLTRAGADVAGITCVGLALVGVLLPVGCVRGEPGRAAGPTGRSSSRRGVWLVVALLGIAFRAADGYGRPVTLADRPGPARVGDEPGRGPGRPAHRRLRRRRARLRGRPAARPGPRRDADRAGHRAAGDAHARRDRARQLVGEPRGGGDDRGAARRRRRRCGSAGSARSSCCSAGGARCWRRCCPGSRRWPGSACAVVTISGVLTAQVRLGSWAALFVTGYGALVIAKAVALGAARRPGPADPAPDGRGPHAGAALGGRRGRLMAVTLGLAAALSQTAP